MGRIVGLLVVGLVLVMVGFSSAALFWLGIVGLMLFVATGFIGAMHPTVHPVERPMGDDPLGSRVGPCREVTMGRSQPTRRRARHRLATRQGGPGRYANALEALADAVTHFGLHDEDARATFDRQVGQVNENRPTGVRRLTAPEMAQKGTGFLSWMFRRTSAATPSLMRGGG